MTHGTHEFVADARNESVLIYLNGVFKPRAEAMVSVFDSGFVLGDGVWEGLRVVDGQPAFLDAHFDRLYEGAKAIMLDIGMDRAARQIGWPAGFQICQLALHQRAKRRIHGSKIRITGIGQPPPAAKAQVVLTGVGKAGGSNV